MSRERTVSDMPNEIFIGSFRKNKEGVTLVSGDDDMTDAGGVRYTRSDRPADERMEEALQEMPVAAWNDSEVLHWFNINFDTICAALRTTPHASPLEAQPASMSSHAAPDDDQDGGDLSKLKNLITEPGVLDTANEKLHTEKNRVIRELVAAIEFMRTKGINASASFVRCAPDAEMRMIQALDAMDLVLTKPENAAVIEGAKRSKWP